MKGASTLINVKDYGAKGDGVTDDTAAIHAARDQASGGDLYFPAGTYRTTGLTANVSGQQWKLNKGATIKAVDGAISPVITATTTGIRITGGVIDGNRPSAGSGVAGIYTFSNAASDLWVDKVIFQHIAGYGIQAAASRTKITGCQFSDVASQAIIINPASADISDCEIISNYIDKSSEAVSTIYAAVSVGGTATLKNYRPKITGNTVLMPSNPTNNTGLPICIEVRSFALYAVVTNNTTSGGSMGVSIDRSDFSTISDNTIYGPNWYGVELAGSQNCVVSANTIDGASLLGGGYNGSQATSAIVTDGATRNSDYTSIVGNKIANMVAGAGSSGINIGTGTYFVISDNLIAVPTHGIIFSATGAATVSGNTIIGGSSSNSRGMGLLNTSGRFAISGNIIRSFDRGIELNASSTTLDNVSIASNEFGPNITTNIYPNVSGSGSLGTNIIIDANSGMNSPVPSFVHVTDATQGTNSSGFTVNRVYYLRSRGAGYISSIGIQVGTSSGNLRVGIYRATSTGAAAKPAGKVADSGSVACPVAGYATISLGASYWVNVGDYLAIQCDNGTASIIGFSMGGSSAIAAPFAYSEDPGSFTLPATATPNTGAGNIYRLIGV